MSVQVNTTNSTSVGKSGNQNFFLPTEDTGGAIGFSEGVATCMNRLLDIFPKGIFFTRKIDNGIAIVIKFENALKSN